MIITRDAREIQNCYSLALSIIPGCHYSSRPIIFLLFFVYNFLTEMDAHCRMITDS